MEVYWGSRVGWKEERGYIGVEKLGVEWVGDVCNKACSSDKFLIFGRT